MDDNLSSNPYECPSCHESFASPRSLSLHLHSCKGSWDTEPSSKRPKARMTTLVQRADELFHSIKRPHTSGHQVNVDRLLVHPSVPSSANAITCDHSTNVNDDDMHAADDYGTGSEFVTEHENNATTTSDETNSASNDHSKFRTHLNPPPGVKFGIHLQHVISSHRGVDLKLYDDIIDLIKTHATTQNTDFSKHKLYHRNELTRTLTTLYNLNDL